MVVDDPIAMTLDASSIAIGRRPNSHDAGCEFYNDGGQWPNNHDAGHEFYNDRDQQRNDHDTRRKLTQTFEHLR